MKKTFKIAFILMLAIITLIAITGCGKKEENKVEEPKIDVEIDTRSKTFKTFSNIKEDYILSIEGEADLGEGEEAITITMAVKGQKLSMDLKTDSERMGIIYKDNTTYVILHDEKTYIKEQGKDEDAIEDMTIFSAEDLDEIKDKEYVVGKEKIDGVDYNYEEYKDEKENETTRFYFQGDDLKYIRTISEDENILLKVNELSSKVDDSLFEVPSDYSEIAM